MRGSWHLLRTVCSSIGYKMTEKNTAGFNVRSLGGYILYIIVLMMGICQAGTSGRHGIQCFAGTELVSIDKEHELCCDGIHKRTDKHGFKQECCMKTDGNRNVIKQQVYALRKQICCEGELFDLPKHPGHRYLDSKCCGQDFYYSDTSFCCNKNTYEKKHGYCHQYDGGEVFVGHNQVVCERWTPNGTLVKVQIHKKDHSCCGTELFNNNNHTHFCDSDQTWPNGAEISECGGELYDKTKQMCCQGPDKDTFYLKPVPSTDETKVRYLGIGADFSCLGNKTVNMDLDQIVQSNNKKFVVPKHFLPCGYTYFDPDNKRTQVDCCNGVVNHASPGMNVACCGKEFIDLDKNHCCNNRKIDTTMLCCGNEIFSRQSGLECCGTELINSSYLCCKPQSSISFPVKKMPGDNQCCGNRTYNTRGMDVCCGGKVLALEQNQTCVSGHVVTVLPTDPEDVKERVEELSPNKEADKDTKDNLNKHACLSCATFMAPAKTCVKKFEYQVYIRDIQTKGTNTFIDVLFLEPYILRKMKLVLQTKGHCGCFRRDELYLFQSNRNILAKVKSGKSRLRFSKRDTFRIIKGKFPHYTVDHKCSIDRYYRRPIVNH